MPLVAEGVTPDTELRQVVSGCAIFLGGAAHRGRAALLFLGEIKLGNYHGSSDQI